MSGLDGVVMPNHLSTFVKGRSESSTGEFLLMGFPDVTGDLVPHIGDEYDVPQCRVTAKSAEHIDIPSGDPIKPIFGNSVDVDDPGEH